ncbi:MAG: alpha-L-fucosidase [Planctomycetes bacterium]|nr:alpha-L-fucosidase [Planctomycetota bacterium]
MVETIRTPGDTDWFVRDRFGLFIHWGLYALPARHEWVKCHEAMTDQQYEKYLRHFDPDLYDPAQWAAAASGAGMKYFVVTTKHHEGFCLWDSKLTDYKATNTPAGRDLLRPMVDAFRAAGLRVGFYHSLLDWHHPQYTIDPYVHPQRNHPDRQKLNASRDQAAYSRYLHGQVRELLTEFGRVDILWADFSFTNKGPEGKGRDDWQSEELYRITRELQPQIILNDRLDLESGWDVKTPEQYQPREWLRVGGKPVVWEACQTFSGSWGYHRDETSWKSVEQLVQMLIDTVSKGGNLLLNVGPTGRGEFDRRALDRLAGMGEWMRLHGRSIYGCTQAPAEFATPQDCRLTWNAEKRRLYVHVFAWPTGLLHMDGLAGKVEYAQLLNDASEVKFGLSREATIQNVDMGRDTLTLQLPVRKPDVTVPVIELFVK